MFEENIAIISHDVHPSKPEMPRPKSMLSTSKSIENKIGQMKAVLYRQTGVLLVLKGCFHSEKIA